MHALDLENVETRSQILSGKLSKEDKFLQEECLPNEVERVESGKFIRGIVIAIASGLLTWAAIIYAILVLL